MLHCRILDDLIKTVKVAVLCPRCQWPSSRPADAARSGSAIHRPDKVLPVRTRQECDGGFVATRHQAAALSMLVGGLKLLGRQPAWAARLETPAGPAPALPREPQGARAKDGGGHWMVPAGSKQGLDQVQRNANGACEKITLVLNYSNSKAFGFS